MARITRVKKAQQRYETVPVLDENGQPKKVPVMKNGQQKMTRAKGGRPGRPVFMTLTVADKTKPLPPEKCGRCGDEITPGKPYKHISPKSGPYGGRRLVRCANCPDWHVWEYSSSLSARTSQIAYDFEQSVADAEDSEDFRSALDEAATAVREIAEEKHQSAANIEDGFGHPTSASEELESVADQLESWADDIENCDVPDLPEPDEVECESCGGTGKADETVDADSDVSPGGNGGENENEDDACEECGGTGQVTPEELSDDELNAWRDEALEACSVINECPV